MTLTAVTYCILGGLAIGIAKRKVAEREELGLPIS